MPFGIRVRVPTPDPNWFYSSLAQVAAAIVGLMGAVLGTRLVTHVADMREERRFIQGDIVQRQESLRGRTQQTAYFSQLIPDKTVADRLADLHQMFPLGSEVKEQDLRALVAHLRGVEQALGPTGGEQQVKGEIHADANLLEQLADRTRRFRSTLVPRPFIAAVLLMAFFGGAGIVWPLWAIPSVEHSFLQRKMLCVFALGVVALIGYFAIELWQLWRLRHLQWTEMKR